MTKPTQTILSYKKFAQLFHRMDTRPNITQTQRLYEALRVMEKHPGKVPIICSPATLTTPSINRTKYLVSGEMTIGQFIHAIRPRIQCGRLEQQALFLFVGKNSRAIPATSALISRVYDIYKSNDGFLYIAYSLENVFG